MKDIMFGNPQIAEYITNKGLSMDKLRLCDLGIEYSDSEPDLEPHEYDRYTFIIRNSKKYKMDNADFKNYTDRIAVIFDISDDGEIVNMITTENTDKMRL